jgi:histidyl-tRNA synthetase
MGTMPTPLFYIVNCGDESIPASLAVLSFLRKNDIYAEFEIEKKTMKSQMKSADKLGVLYTIIIGGDEIASDTISVKYMPTGEQTTISMEKLGDLIGMLA